MTTQNVIAYHAGGFDFGVNEFIKREQERYAALKQQPRNSRHPYG